MRTADVIETAQFDRPMVELSEPPSLEAVKNPECEPVACPDCPNVYHDGQWHQSGPADEVITTLYCPGCYAVRNNWYQGKLYMRGQFPINHRGELRRLVLDEMKLYQSIDPLDKIVRLVDRPRCLVLYTTRTGSIEHIGQSLEDLFGGTFERGSKQSHAFLWKNARGGEFHEGNNGS